LGRAVFQCFPHRRGWAIGIAPLPPKKVSKGARLEWEESIIQAEGGIGV